MGDTSIEWTQRPGTRGVTWNPIRAYSKATGKRGWFCVHASDGCRFCYADTRNQRKGAMGGTGHAYIQQNLDKVRIELHEETLLQPVHWREPRTVFVCSMTDLFGEFHSDEMIDNVFAVMALSPQHTFQVLTKRAGRMREYLSAAHRADDINFAIDKLAGATIVYDDLPLPNVWLGISAERQQEADERIPLLLQTPAAVRFVSLEPLLGAIDLWQAHWGDIPDSDRQVRGRPCIDWAIVGGESGPKARPMHPQWARDLRDQCKAAGVPYFFKQWGAYGFETRPGTEVVLPDLAPNERAMWGDGKTNHIIATFVGKKAAGRLLDGVEHNEFPDTSQRERSAA